MVCHNSSLRSRFLPVVRLNLRVTRHATRRSLLVLDEELVMVVALVVVSVNFPVSALRVNFELQH